MPLPKKIKKNIPLTEPKILLERRKELVDKINQDGTYLPKSLLHADLDGGFLDFVKNELKTIVDGKVIPTIDILMTTQNWAQFTETWDIQNLDNNVEPPFITIVRVPEVKYGTNPSTQYTIPNRRQFFYAQVPTWDGNRVGMDVYKIPQPVPVDITFQVKIVCNRMRELNQFNKVVIEKFSSLQAYQVIKGHYIPIKMGNISDESVMDMEKRKYYIQSYEFTMLGFLIDENEFEVSPAISRVLQVYEVDTRTISRGKSNKIPNDQINLTALFKIGNNVISENFDYTTDLTITNLNNIDSYDVYINNEYYGVDVNVINVNTGDVVKFEVVKLNPLNEGTIQIVSKII
jgi:hypothetical protein